MFQFYTPKSRVVYFHTGEIALHNFESGEWVISVMIGNQHLEVPASYLLEESEDLGDPRCGDFVDKVNSIASNIKSGVGWGTDKNSYRAVLPKVCDLDNPNFCHSERFSDYKVGRDESSKKEEKS